MCLWTVMPRVEVTIGSNMCNSQLLHCIPIRLLSVQGGGTTLTRGLGLASILKMMSQGSMTGSHAATTWLKDHMLLRKPMYACMPQHQNINHAHFEALRHFMHTTCPQDMDHIMPILHLSSLTLLSRAADVLYCPERRMCWTQSGNA
jgi:hypothetical protein